ncbi:MAG: M48 family metallopeptidase [Arcobacteraceae bacterium]|nr:M48 family metallopeptidase [Arcobacteraceae bacterium]
MLEVAIIGYCIYFLINFYTTFMQIDYVQKAKDGNPVILNQGGFKVAGNYSIESNKLGLLTILYDFVLFFLWIGFGLEILNNLTNEYIGWMKAVIFIDSFIIINWLLGLPFELYSTFVIDKKYGFSNMTKGLYIKDTLKSGVLFLVFGSAVIAGLSYIIESFPSWWIVGFAFIFAIIILINMLYPVIRDKMFDKFSPLSDKELETKINHLLEQVGFKSSGVFSVDASKRDNRLNAYFGGLGSTKRVVLFDTLVEKLTHNELLAVLGHELGHFKNGDILKNIAIMGVVMFAFFGIFGNLPEELFLELHLSNEPYAIIVVFMMFSPILSFFLMPLISAMSRHNEYAADRFGSDLQTKDDLVSALLKLANENKSFPLSHPLYIFFHYSHPPLVERFKALGFYGAGIGQIKDDVALQSDCGVDFTK